MKRHAVAAVSLAALVAAGVAAQPFSVSTFAAAAIEHHRRGDISTAWSFLPLAASADLDEATFAALEGIVHERALTLLAENDPLLLLEIRDFVEDHPRFGTERVLAALAETDSTGMRARGTALADAALAKAAAAWRALALDPGADVDPAPWEREFRERMRALPGPAPLSGPASGVDPLAATLALGLLALIATGASLTAVHARNARYAEEQRRSTEEALVALRTPATASPDLPSAPDPELDALSRKCLGYAREIDAATSRPGSSLAVASLVRGIALEAGKDERDAFELFCAALVYDIGFLSIDADVLAAKDIGEEEFQAIREHPKLGLNRIFFVPQARRQLFRESVLMHHENLDGSGYPAMLQGAAIPFVARAVRAAESWLAIVSGRARGTSRGAEEALDELRAKSGTYDRAVVDALARVVAARESPQEPARA